MLQGRAVYYDAFMRHALQFPIYAPLAEKLGVVEPVIWDRPKGQGQPMTTSIAYRLPRHYPNRQRTMPLSVPSRRRHLTANYCGESGDWWWSAAE